MVQIFHPYNIWEDWHNGMYNNPSKQNLEVNINTAIDILGNAENCKEQMQCVIDSWNYTVEHHLTNLSINRKAWLGAAACNINFNVTEIETRFAWARLSDYQRYIANEIAEKIILSYERKNSRVHTNMGGQMLF